MYQLFESIKVEQGRVCNIDFHLWRISWSLKEENLKAISKYLRAIDLPKDGLYKLKLLYSLEGNFTTFITPYTPNIAKIIKVIDSDIEYPKKYIDRDELDLLKKDGEEILISKEGELRDCTIYNIALWIDDRWLTPKNPLLLGTTRERLLRGGFLNESILWVDDLFSAKKIALMNAMIGFVVINPEEIVDGR